MAVESFLISYLISHNIITTPNYNKKGHRWLKKNISSLKIIKLKRD